MDYYIVNDIKSIPDKATFYYLSNEGIQIKCKKHGKYGFTYKIGTWTYKRYQAYNENWYAVVGTRTAKKMGII